MLAPKKTKFRKAMRGDQIKGRATRINTVSFGQFAIKSMNPAWISSRQIEAARRVIAGYTKRGGKVWIRIFPDKPISAKGSEMPMGKGKGPVDHYVAVVKPGTILFELAGIDVVEARRALELAGHKLPVKVKFIQR